MMQKGILLCSIAASPHPSTVSYIESMLRKSTYSAIVILGNVEQEAALKQVKMNIYALLGKLSLEVGVYMELKEQWNESNISTAIGNATRSGDSIYGVLCCPEFGVNDLGDLDMTQKLLAEQRKKGAGNAWAYTSSRLSVIGWVESASASWRRWHSVTRTSALRSRRKTKRPEKRRG